MKVVILGGGISGLSAAWYIRKQYPKAEISLFEKEGSLGGWMQTCNQSGFLFEKGPRLLHSSRCSHLLALICEVGLENELIVSKASAQKQYLWCDGRLRSVFAFWPAFFSAFLREPFLPKGQCSDESVYDFIERRLGAKIAATFADAFTLGIYAADARLLSMRSCFYPFFRLEQEHGSLLLGMAKSFFQKKKQMGSGALFTLRTGMQHLIETLAKKSQVKIHLQSEVKAIRNAEVCVNGAWVSVDWVVSALPVSVIGRLSNLWNDVQETDFHLIHLAYQGNVLQKPGSGYFIPTKEKEDLFGMIWDSSIFPEQNIMGETRVTVMTLEGNVETAVSAMQRHLGVLKKPIFSVRKFAKQAIPRFSLGYSLRLAEFENAVKVRFPRMILLGNYLRGASVDACIALAQKVKL